MLSRQIKKATTFFVPIFMTMGGVRDVDSIKDVEDIEPTIKETIIKKNLDTTDKIPLVAVGYSHALILKDNILYGMGSNTYGQLATGILGEIYKKPIIIDTSYIDGNIVDIKASNYNSVILTNTNRVYVSGANSSAWYHKFTELTSGLPKDKIIKEIGVGSSSQVCITYNDRTIYANACNTFGQLATNCIEDITIFKKVNIPDDYKHYTLGRVVSAYISSDNKVYGAGRGADITMEKHHNYPVFVLTKSFKERNLTPIKISSHHGGLLVLTDSGDIYSTGSGMYGALGNGNTDNSNEWTKVTKPHGVNRWIDMSSNGDYNVFGFGDNGKVYAWGGNNNGSLGISETSRVIASPQLMYYEDENKLNSRGREFNLPVKLISNASVSIAVMEDGSIYTWGDGTTSGQDSKCDVLYPRKLTLCIS